MSGKKRSNVWLHFTNKADKGICRYCELEISIKNGNISNLTRHLNMKHPTVDRGRTAVNPVLFIPNEQPDVTFELEEDPNARPEPDVAGSYRVRWTSKSEQRERKRLRNADSRVKRQRYVEQMDDTEEFASEEIDEIMPDETRQLKFETSTAMGTTVNPPPCDDDGDRHFLLSLLPLMKQLSPEDNMDIRIQMQNSFKEKLFPPKNPLAGEVIVESENMH